MRLGLYTFISILLMMGVGSVVYVLTGNTFLIEVMGVQLNLPVAVWVVLPMFVLFFYTFMHLLVRGLKQHFLMKRWEKDAHTLEDALYWSILGEPKEEKYLTPNVRQSASLLAKAQLEILDDIEIANPKLAKVVKVTAKIGQGEYVDLKELKLNKVLRDENPYVVQNCLNRLKHDEKFVPEVMKSSSNYSAEVRNKALEIFAKRETFSSARAYVQLFDIENFLVMLNRAKGNDEMALTQEIMKEFIDAIKPGCRDFLRIAEVGKKLFTPDENLALFYLYQNKTAKAQYGYLYLLFEYELMEEISKFFDEQGENEFMKFRALYTLKKTHAKYKLEDIIDINTVCEQARLY